MIIIERIYELVSFRKGIPRYQGLDIAPGTCAGDHLHMRTWAVRIQHHVIPMVQALPRWAPMRKHHYDIKSYRHQYFESIVDCANIHDLPPFLHLPKWGSGRKRIY